MSTRLIPFEAWHLAEVEPREPGRVVRGIDARLIAEKYAHLGPAWSLLRLSDARIIACGGIILPPWRGHAEAWMVVGAAARASAFALHRSVKRQMEVVIAAHGLRRLQAVARSDFPAARAWLKRLGFEAEGVLRCYGPDLTDCIMMARVG